VSGRLDIVVLGLALRSSWGNGHATTYRALVRALLARGHRVRFLERDCAWYAENDDTPADLAASVSVYNSLDELADTWDEAIAAADLVIVGSYVPDGDAVGRWVLAHTRGVTAFYDIDTPVTLAKLARGDCEYLDPASICRYGLYLSFTGGPTLGVLERRYGANALPLYCSVDAERYAPESAPKRFDLGYMGTYSADREVVLDKLLTDVAREWPRGRFVVAGPQYPAHLDWPANVTRIEHVGPAAHRRFYNEQRFTLNVTRADMAAAGYSPSVRLFEAAACATPIVSDAWTGIETFFEPGREILVAHDAQQVRAWLADLPEARCAAIGHAARRRVLAEHTAEHRAETLERYVDRVAPRQPSIRSTRSICNDSAA
jgi:spore maturation protein CgeB